eukprot:Clim_evm49s253 gene=Clim_evmTU49s253
MVTMQMWSRSVMSGALGSWLHGSRQRRMYVTGGQAVCEWVQKFEEAKVPEAEHSAMLLLQHALGESSGSVDSLYESVKDCDLDNSTISKFTKYCRQRLQHQPLQYIIGLWAFHNIEVEVAAPVLIPRPETETLVDLALDSIEAMDTHPIRVLDVGCGTGCISLAIVHALREMGKPVSAHAIDTNATAVALAQRNAERMGLTEQFSVEQGDVGVFVPDEPFDLLVSNPPYLTSAQMTTLPKQIRRFEDMHALHGGKDGLDTIRSILKASDLLVKPGAQVIIEIDPDQVDNINKFMRSKKARHLTAVTYKQDLLKRDRFLVTSVKNDPQ